MLRFASSAAKNLESLPYLRNSKQGRAFRQVGAKNKKKPLEEFNQQEALDQQSNKIVTHSLTCDERGRSESSSG